MRTLVWTLLLLGCSSSEPSPSIPISESEPVSRPDPWDATSWVSPSLTKTPPPPAPPIELPATFTFARSSEPIVQPTPRQLVAAMPARAILTLAVTDDGRAAVTADRSHTARVWPSLDGKREPVVVRMRPPSALALARDGEQLVIGALDAAGQLELVVTKESGESVRRVAIEAARPFVTIHAVPAGFVAMTDERGWCSSHSTARSVRRSSRIPSSTSCHSPYAASTCSR